MDTTPQSHAYSGLEQCDTSNHTKIDYESIPLGEQWLDDHHILCKKRWYKHLNSTNGGYRNGFWTNTPYETWEINNYRIHSFAADLGLTRAERWRAKERFISFELDDFGEETLLVAYALCCYIVEQDQRDERRTHPQVPTEGRPSEFVEMIDQIGYNEHEIISMYGKVQSKLMSDSQQSHTIANMSDANRSERGEEGWWGEGGI